MTRQQAATGATMTAAAAATATATDERRNKQNESGNAERDWYDESETDQLL